MLERYVRETKYVVKLAASRFLTYRQGAEPNIVISAHGRGGSTLLSDMLSAESGMWTTFEPFFVAEDVPSFRVTGKWMPLRKYSLYFDLDPEEADRVKAYTAALTAGQVPGGYCRYPKFPFRADRALLKILHAQSLMGWLSDLFGLQLIILLRHPAAQSLAAARHGWCHPSEVYLERPEFLRQFLSDDQIELGLRITREGSDWQRRILDWVIQTILSLHDSRKATMMITLEELTLEPAAMVGVLCERLGLRDSGRILRDAQRVSGSSLRSPSEHRDSIKRRDAWGLLQSWRGKVSPIEADQGQEILDQYGITIYNMSRCIPDHRYLCFPDRILAAEEQQAVKR